MLSLSPLSTHVGTPQTQQRFYPKLASEARYERLCYHAGVWQTEVTDL